MFYSLTLCLGATGRGTPELTGVRDRVHIINSTLGKALGGACGGYTTGPKQVLHTSYCYVVGIVKGIELKVQHNTLDRY